MHWRKKLVLRGADGAQRANFYIARADKVSCKSRVALHATSHKDEEMRCQPEPKTENG